MGNNSAIECRKNACIIFGRNFGITGGFRIASRKQITIGDNFLSSWGTGVFDTDFHNLINLQSHEVYNADDSVVIGDDYWLCQNSIVLK